MIKQFSAGDITVRPFSTFKHWTIQSVDSSSVDKYGQSTYYKNKIEINRGLAISSSFYPSGSEHYVAENEPINPSGKYARNVYSMTDAMFYKYASEPIKLFGVEEYTQDPVTGKQEIRKIHNRITAATLKHNVFGEKIIPNTVEIIDNSNIHKTLKIYDDGYTNLYITGSHFPNIEKLSAVRDTFVPIREWMTGSGQFYVTFDDGSIQYVNEINARQYMAMGFQVTYIPPDDSDSDWFWNSSSYQDLFIPSNEHFGESVSCWTKYIAVGSSMDENSLSTSSIGYAALFKYDESQKRHRLIRKFSFPFTQSAEDPSIYFKDSYGYSVSVHDDFLAIGSPTGSACSSSIYPGFVTVHDKYKGGTDNWGMINLLKGRSNGDRFGTSVAIDNNTLAIGAPGYSGSRGAVYIYKKRRYMDSGSCLDINTGSAWIQVITQEDFCKELQTSSYIASQSYTPTFVSGNYTWEFDSVLSSSVYSPNDNFGWSLAIDSDRLIVGTNKTGKGYAVAFTCSYYSASLTSCPTASWRQHQIFFANEAYGDLNKDAPEYSIDVSNTIVSDKFGYSVDVSGDNIVIGCKADKAFIPHLGYSDSPVILGAAYFYNYRYDEKCLRWQYDLLTKTFGNREYYTNNNFGHAVSIDGSTAAVSSLPDTLARGVDYVSGSYVIENFGYQSTGSTDSVLGRVTMYNMDYTLNSWYKAGELRRNKEADCPYNIFGYSVSIASDFMCVGAPIVNIATQSAYNDIVNYDNLSGSFPSSYSGSIFAYDMGEYQADQHVGNVFYKNGYIVITSTSSMYENALTGTGSCGFTLNYQGAHTIFEHEYLVSIRPGEFNYSTNPTSLQPNPLVFDVNQDGKFDEKDVDIIMRYLRLKKFYDDFVLDDNGLVLEQDTLTDYSWWARDILQTESEDVLMQELTDIEYFASSSFAAFNNAAYQFIKTKLYDTGILDIDGDGKINMNDGYILALYVLNRLNPTTLSKYLTSNSKRRYVKDIEDYLNPYCGNDPFRVNPLFLGYQYSSSYDPTGSYLAPCITTVGLYQDNQLVAVGKLGRPIKNLIDWPINIVVRFDT